MVDVQVLIVASIIGTNQDVTLKIPTAGPAVNRPALMLLQALEGIAASIGVKQAGSSSLADCQAVAQLAVANHFPTGYGIEQQQDPDYQGHFIRDTEWVPIPGGGGGGDFGYSFAITREVGGVMGRLFQDMTVKDTGGALRLLRAQFYLVVQRA